MNRRTSLEDLDRELRRYLDVDDTTVDRLVAGASLRHSKVSSGGDPLATGEQPAFGWTAVAALLVAACVIAVGVTRESTRSTSHSGIQVAALPSPIRLNLTPGPERSADGDEAPGLGRLILDSDLVLLGSIESTPEGRLEFAVSSILRGAATPAAELLTADIGAIDLEEEAPQWREGERYVFFVHRPAGTTRLRLTHGGAGRQSLPLGGFFERVDIESAIARRPLDGERLAAWVLDRGPSAISYARFHLQDVCEWRAAAASPPVQSALRNWLIGTPKRVDVDRSDLLFCLEFAAAATLDALPQSVIDRLREEYERLSPGYQGWFHARDFLRPFAARGDAWAAPLVAKFVERTEAEVEAAPPGRTGFQKWRLDAMELLAGFDPAAAVAGMWSVHAALPVVDKGTYDFHRGDVLLALTALDPDRAAAEIVKETKERRRRGAHLWIDALVATRSEEAGRLWQEIAEDPSFDPAFYGAWSGPLPVLDRAGVTARLAEVRETVRARLFEKGTSISSRAAWLKIWFASGGNADAVTPSLAARCLDLTDKHSTLPLLKILSERSRERWITWADPTDKEITDAWELLSRRR